MNKEPLVSILCLTYNHAGFISQAIEGFLMQKTNFVFEVLIHDDASTDGTSDIIREYEKKYPEIIKPIYQTENQFSKGVKISLTYQYPRAKGKYIAFCEGDDYWTDQYKLQKQVDFLENNPDFSMCFSDVNIISNNSNNYSTREIISRRNVFTISDLLKYGNFMHTATVVFRNNFDKMMPINSITGDYFLHLHNASFGKIKFIDEVMVTYRVHEGGFFSQRENWTLDKKIKNAEIQIMAYDKAKSVYSNGCKQKVLFNKMLFSERNKLRFYLLENENYKEAKRLAIKLLLLFIRSFQKDIKTFFSIIITVIRPRLLSGKILRNKHITN